MNRSELQRLIDSCRGDADLQLPEFQPLAKLIATDPAVQNRWEKSQQMDAEIRQIIHDVAVPSGLQGRLVSALQLSALPLSESVIPLQAQQGNQAQQTNPAQQGNSASDANVDSSNEIILATSSTRSGRSWKVWTAGIAGIAALVLISLFLVSGSEPQLASEDQARIQAVQWISQLDDAKWKLTDAPSRLMPPMQLLLLPRRWQSVSTGSRSMQAVCYDLTSPRGPTAFMIVVWTQQPTSLANAPPLSPYPKGQWHIAAWKSATSDRPLIYLLAVEQGHQYQNTIRPPSRVI